MVCGRCRIERVYRLRTHWLPDGSTCFAGSGPAVSQYDYDWICFRCGERGFEQGAIMRYDDRPGQYRELLRQFHPEDEELR